MTRLEKLVSKLDIMKDRFRCLSIIVKAEPGAYFIGADDPGRLEKLRRMVQGGGKPIGLVGINKDGTDCFHQAFPGCRRDEPVLAFLAQMQLAHITGDFSMFPPDFEFAFKPYIVQ